MDTTQSRVAPRLVTSVPPVPPRERSLPLAPRPFIPTPATSATLGLRTRRDTPRGTRPLEGPVEDRSGTGIKRGHMFHGCLPMFHGRFHGSRIEHTSAPVSRFKSVPGPRPECVVVVEHALRLVPLVVHLLVVPDDYGTSAVRYVPVVLRGPPLLCSCHWSSPVRGGNTPPCLCVSVCYSSAHSASSRAACSGSTPSATRSSNHPAATS